MSGRDERGAAEPPARALPDGYEAIAGQRDAAVRARTGRSWAEWVRALDAQGAAEMSHAEIARRVGDEVASDWWAQMVAVGYERLIGRRAVGQACDGAYQASKSKTVRAPRERTYEAARALATDAGWLGGLALSGETPPKSMRFTASDGSRAALWFTDKGDRCTVAVSHTGLASPEAVARAKEGWARRLTALARAASAGDR